MKKLAVLIIGRDYFLPYVKWLVEQDGKMFDIVGFVDNDVDIYVDNVPGYKKRSHDEIEDVMKQSDIVLSLGYWKIIPKHTIDAVPLGILNIHHSHMLKYRGRHASSWAIINNEKMHGSTFHYMSETLDAGQIIASEAVEIEQTDTAETLFVKVNDLGLKLLKENLGRVLDKNISHELSKPSGDYRSYKERDLVFEIPKNLSDEEFERRVRALTFTGKPKPYVVINGRKIYQVI